jgi:hypothetical protein
MLERFALYPSGPATDDRCDALFWAIRHRASCEVFAISTITATRPSGCVRAKSAHCGMMQSDAWLLCRLVHTIILFWLLWLKSSGEEVFSFLLTASFVHHHLAHALAVIHTLLLH